MRGKITMKILERTAETAVDISDLFAVFLTAGYGASYSKLEYLLSKREDERLKRNLDKKLQIKLKQRYQNVLYKLKKDGLIEEKIKNERRFFTITKKGTKRLNFLKGGLSLATPPINYQKKTGNKIVIVIFDIPEKERRKRQWLREVLKNIGLKMAQKSVWIGKMKIPKQFLDDLYVLKIIDFVEIFEISSSGSLRTVI